MAGTYDRIDQWLDWGDHTVTVDPVGNAAWVHDGENGRHLETKERGRAIDAADVKHLMGMLSSQKSESTHTYVPQWDDLQRTPFPSKPPQGYCDPIEGDGRLPTIVHHIRRQSDVPKGDIERQVYKNTHTISSKVLSRAGVPDHGLPSTGIIS